MTIIKACMAGNEESGKWHFLIDANGHAKGSVEVCAGVSALMQALHCYLLNAKDVVKNTLIETNQNGHYRIEFHGDRLAMTAYLVILSGLLSIEAGYPDYIKVSHTVVDTDE